MRARIFICVVYISVYLYWPYLCPGMYICLSIFSVLMPHPVGVYAPTRQVTNIGMVDLISARMQYHQLSTLIKFSTLLQLDYL